MTIKSSASQENILELWHGGPDAAGTKKKNYDGVYSHCTLNTLKGENLQGAISELKTIVRPAGLVCITVMDERNPNSTPLAENYPFATSPQAQPIHVDTLKENFSDFHIHDIVQSEEIVSGSTRYLTTILAFR